MVLSLKYSSFIKKVQNTTVAYLFTLMEILQRLTNIVSTPYVKLLSNVNINIISAEYHHKIQEIIAQIKQLRKKYPNDKSYSVQPTPVNKRIRKELNWLGGFYNWTNFSLSKTHEICCLMYLK